MKKNITEKRISNIDFIRGISMLCIIAGHMGLNTITRIVFTFHVPIFFIISGIFFKVNKEKLKTNVVKLLKPYWFTVLCVAFLDGCRKIFIYYLNYGKINISLGFQMMIKNIIAGLYGSGSKTNFLNYNVTAIGAIWFYLALIWASLFCYFIFRFFQNNFPQKFLRNMGIIIISMIIWGAGYYSADQIWLPTSIQAGCCALIFMSIGYLFLGNVISKKLKIWLFLLSSVVWGFAIYSSFSLGYMSLVRCAFPDPIVNILGAFAAGYILLMFGKLLGNSYFSKSIQWFGKNSMVVLSFHLIELNIIPWDKLIKIPIGGIVLSSIVIYIIKILWCIIGIVYVKKNAFLRWVYSIK